MKEKKQDKVFEVRDCSGKIHFIQADAFNYLADGTIAWLYVGMERVASFDRPQYIKECKTRK